ncbi:MAG: GNAT family N-acetyltransferase [Bacillota bacterium]|nr:GNAT family N-acetyltransferase [Bacillota bacterium]
MSYEITYREATIDDKDIYLAVDLMKKLCIYQKMEDTSMINEDNMRKLLADNAGNGIFAYIDGEPVAFMYYYYNYPMLIGNKCMYIDCLYIEDGYRHCGVGTDFLKYISRKALDDGCGRLEWLCLTWNTPALDMYDKIGAKKMDTVSLHRVDLETIVKLANS